MEGCGIKRNKGDQMIKHSNGERCEGVELKKKSRKMKELSQKQ